MHVHYQAVYVCTVHQLKIIVLRMHVHYQAVYVCTVHQLYIVYVVI
jgi:hypothetical protein